MSILKKISLVLIISLLLSACGLPSGGETPTATNIDLPQVAPSALPTIEETENPEPAPTAAEITYTIVDTGQNYCYDNAISIPCPEAGSDYFGQDAQYLGSQPGYVDNGDGTITDLVTGLMWAKDPVANLTYDQAVAGAADFNLAGYSDWLLPTIKELYSLVLFSGTDPGDCESEADCPDLVAFIDTSFFSFQYGEALSEAVFISNTPSDSGRAAGSLIFGVDFAEGRLKGYAGGENTFFVRYVRGEAGYGVNQFVDNGDGTISDQASGLTWMQTDSQKALAWGEALAYCEDLSWAGQDDWRLPNAKELHSIFNPMRGPDTSNTAAIDSLFQSTPLTNEAGQSDYGYYWSSTSHLNRQLAATEAVYLAFGRALGYSGDDWTDIHGAGAQRSDPKAGDPASYPQGGAAQGEAIRILNYARCVRGGVSAEIRTGGEADPNVSSAPAPSAQATPKPDSSQPPQEAFDACEGKQANTACHYEWIFGRQEGVCNALFGQLVCMPGVVLPTFPSP